MCRQMGIKKLTDAFHDYVNTPKNTHPHTYIHIYVNELYIHHIIVIEMNVSIAHDIKSSMALSVKGFNFMSGFTRNF